jgi:hypothetical protein
MSKHGRTGYCCGIRPGDLRLDRPFGKTVVAFPNWGQAYRFQFSRAITLHLARRFAAKTEICTPDPLYSGKAGSYFGHRCCTATKERPFSSRGMRVAPLSVPVGAVQSPVDRAKPPLPSCIPCPQSAKRCLLAAPTSHTNTGVVARAAPTGAYVLWRRDGLTKMVVSKADWQKD